MNIGIISSTTTIIIIVKGSPHASRSKTSDFLAVLHCLVTSILVTGLPNERYALYHL